MSRRPPIWYEAYLSAFGQTGHVGHSAAAAGVSRDSVQAHRRKHPEFAEAEEEARAEAVARLEAEAHRRAVEGWDEPVFGRVDRDQDGLVGVIRKYDSSLLQFLLRGNKPAVYGNKVELAGTLGLEGSLGVKDDPRLQEAAAAFLAAAVGDGGADESGSAGDPGQQGAMATG